MSIGWLHSICLYNVLLDCGDPSDETDLSDAQRWELYSPWLERDDPVIRANATICLIHQAIYLLDQQIAVLEREFVQEGGYSEQLATARLEHRRHRGSTPRQAAPIPHCPKCGQSTVLRTAKSGPNTGEQF